ncbi:MAG: DUF177 domain-containing protein [Kiritimatiellia bacterium]
MKTPERLIVDLNRLDEDGEIFEGEIPADALDMEEEEFFQPRGGIVYKLMIQALGSELLVRGSLAQIFVCRCARCDKKFDLEVKKADFIESFEINEENAFPDLTDAIREAIILNLPAYPRCSETCKGLCGVCGVNLNESSCNCNAESGDMRWSALDALDSLY